MSIYRGAGGSGDATNDATVSQVQTYASQAATSATNAAASATAAAASESGATTQATLATSAKNDSVAISNTVAGYVAGALASETAAAGSATAAAASAAAAALSEGNASGSASDAADSATTATNQATAASTSATNSANSAASALAIYGNTTAMNTAVTNASNSATAAATSATNASTSASNASTSASAASSSASAASTSASAAATSAGNANTSASNAATSEANTLSIYGSTIAVNDAVNNSLANRNAAAASATAASTSASASATSATASATSASAAATSAAAASAVALGNEPVRHSVRPSLLLDFANTKQLDPRITFTRASTASFYDGRTTAKAEENLFLNSEDIAAGWSRIQCVATANTTVAPNGTTTGDTFTANAFTGTIFVQYQATPVGATTISIFAKAGTHPYIQILNASDAQAFANFDLTAGAGVVGTKGTKTTSSIVDAGSGWYRCIATFDATTTFGLNNRIYFAPSASATYAQAITAAGTETIILWGAQLEQRSSVTAYTPTTTAAITNYIPALQTAASGTARFDHNPTTGESLGLLIEEQRVNLLLRSEEFDNALWGKVAGTVSSNVDISPDGLQTTDLYIPSAISATQATYQAVSTTAAAQTFSIYAKANGFNYIQLYFANAQNNTAYANFDLSSGTVTAGTYTSATATSVGNGWYRCTLTATTAASTGGVNIQVISTSTSARTAVMTGNGYSGIYIWGAQLEAGAFATSYIPTVASQVTRSPDAASITGTNFSSWYNQAEGSFFLNFRNNDPALPVVNSKLFLLMDNSSSKRVLYQSAGSSNIASFDGTNVLGTSNHTLVNASNLAVSTYSSTSKTLALNAGAVVTGSTVAAYSQSSSLTIAPLMSIKKLAYYPEQLTNAEIIALTTV